MQLTVGQWKLGQVKLMSNYGPEEGLEIARQLHINWILLTIGDPGASIDESAHPWMLEEVIVADGGEGNSPHCEIIRDAFDAHNIPCDSTCPCP